MSTFIEQVSVSRGKAAAERGVSSTDRAGGARRTGNLAVLSDIFAVGAATALTAWWMGIVQPKRQWELFPSLLAVLILPLQAKAGMYVRIREPWERRVRVALAAQVLLLLAGGLALLAIGAQSEQVWCFVLAVAAFLPLSLIGRRAALAVMRWYFASPRHVCYVLGIGSGEGARAARERLEADEELGCKVVGWVEPSRDGATNAKLREYLAANPVDVVMAAGRGGEGAEPQEWASSTLEMGLDFCIASEFSDIDPLNYPAGTAGTQRLGMRMEMIRGGHQRTSYLAMKRLLDATLAAVALIAFSWLFLLIAILVKATSPGGPIFYRWNVLGKNRKPFVGYKFRTMIPNADTLKQSLMPFNEMSGAAFKMQNDPRVTPLGRWLRKLSLDELPQLYSVVKGDMSLVGPRPPSKAESLNFEYWQHRKLSVKPGITCLWQISGRNTISSFAHWVSLDLEYIRTAGLLTDLKILLRTIPVVLKGTGAC
jgi:exopolysaccharide biosynthesis polyprenyl glycosylphosphotransferase